MKLKDIFQIIALPITCWFFPVYWASKGYISIAKGGGDPIYFSEEPGHFILVSIIVFGLGLFALVGGILKSQKRNEEN